MPVLRRVLAAVCGVVAVTGGMTACTSDDDDDGGPDLPITESRGPAGPVPDGLDDFYGQEITWRDCGEYATTEFSQQAFAAPDVQCSRIEVPLDYAEPDGTSIEIGVLRKPATGADRIGSLVTNPGGPGVSGMEAAGAMSVSPTMQQLGERFDLVGFDPRGVGASEPTVQCLTDEERDADRADDSEEDGSADGVTEQEKREREFADKCEERTEHGADMLANMGTRDVAKDLDVLRSVLGDGQLSYVGYSYGTRIGYTYADHFGDNVRALLLDGALDPEQDAVDSQVAQGEGFGSAFDEFVDWCVDRDDCAVGDDPDGATQEYQDLVQPLVDNNVDAGDGRQLSFEDASTATVHALYSEDRWQDLNSALNELRRQRGESMLALADEYNERGSDGSYTTTQDAFTAIRCVDDPRETDSDRMREAQRKFAEVAPFLSSGKPPSSARDACAFWPVDNTLEPGLPDVDGVPPSLVVSTTNDPATPFAAGKQLATAMGGTLLTYEGTQHTVFGQGNSCVDEAGVEYLVDGTMPEDGTRCAEE